MLHKGEIIVTDNQLARLKKLARAFCWGPRQTMARVLEEGLCILESQKQQAEQVCTKCRNADGVEQGSYGDWYCAPCWRVATTEGEP